MGGHVPADTDAVRMAQSRRKWQFPMSPNEETGFTPTNTPFDETKYAVPYEVQRVALLESLIPTGNGANAIDLGCGPGHFSRVLTTRGWRTTAVDTDSSNIALAGAHAAETRLGDALSVLATLPAAHFELAIAFEIIEHMPLALGTELVTEIARVLKPGGRLLISTPNRHSPEGLGGYYWGEKLRKRGRWTAWDKTHVHIYSSREILQLLAASGLTVMGTTGYHYEGHLPVIGKWKLPLQQSRRFPLNRFGFNVVVECRRP